MKGKRKTVRLTDAERHAVAEYAINHPEESAREIALRFGCTEPQVRLAKEKADSGEIIVRRERVSDLLRTQSIMSNKDRATMIEDQMTRLLAQLEADPDLSAEKRAWAMDKVLRAERTLQEMRLIGAVKQANVGIIYELVRLFEPAATEKEIIQYYLQAEERWKSLQR